MTGDELTTTPPVVVLQANGRWWRFTDPERVIVATRPDEVLASVKAVEFGVEQGLFAAGYLSYEAGAAYGLAVHHAREDGLPLMWFGLYRERAEIKSPAAAGEYHLGEWRPSLSFPAYRAGIDRIKQAIAAGDTYQANYTFHLRADFDGDAWTLFANMSAGQRARYCAFIDLGRFVICSASPELFFRLEGAAIESRPMKGTAPRGLTTADDREQIDQLRGSEKNLAENVMIVDMIRNDLGRIARTGSVEVPDLFTIERYPTLLQMTSTVTARTDASPAEILAAIFPCASITGAPKVRTMQIIHELEREARGVYTGAIGFIAPGPQAQFNVAIRTAVVDQALGCVSYGVGSGVVWDSDAAAEYDECLLKARVLDTRRNAAAEFRLLESLRWTPAEGYFLLARHLERLADSAEYFGFPFRREEIEQAMTHAAIGLVEPGKVRILLDRDGRIEIDARPLSEGAKGEPVHLGLARLPVSSADVRLYHKTTRRDPYDDARASRPDCDDVILWNERGELTEASAANLLLTINGRQWTPPVASGLLAGTMRGYLLDSGDIEERVLTFTDLSLASEIWLINSVRGRQAAVLKPLQDGSTP